MSEDTASQVETFASQPEPEVEQVGAADRRARLRPKHRGVGLKVGHFSFKRLSVRGKDADRRAVMMLIGAAVPLPLLFVGVMLYDAMAHRSPEPAVALASALPGHSKAALHRGKDGAHGAPAARPEPHGVHGASAARPEPHGVHGAPAARPEPHGGHGAPAARPEPHGVHGAPAARPEPHGVHGAPAARAEPHGVHGAPAARAESHGAHSAPAARAEPHGAHSAPTAAADALASRAGQSQKSGSGPHAGGPLVRAWARLQGWLGQGEATPALSVPSSPPQRAVANRESPLALPAVIPPPGRRPPAPTPEPEKQLEPGYVPRSRTEAIESARAARQSEPSAQPTWSARVVASMAAWFLASSRKEAAGGRAVKSGTPVKVATPDPALLTRWAKQVSARLKIQLEPAGSGWYRYRTSDGLARINLERLPDGGAQLQLVVDMAFLSSVPEVQRALPDPRRYPGGLLEAFLERFPGSVAFWLKQRPGFGLVDRFVATYMPPGPGTSPATRLGWWADMLRARVDEASRPREAAAGQVWTPTFNVGARLGQSFLAGQEFTLQLYVPPEDGGL